MENIQVDTAINEVLVSQGGESLTVEWSTGDHHSCGPGELLLFSLLRPS